MKSATQMQGFVAKWIVYPQRDCCTRFMGGRDDGIGGVVAIEFAIVAVILIIMMVCTVDLGMGFYRKMQVQNAAQAGAQYAAARGFGESSIASAVTAATSFSGISASPAPTQFCGCPSIAGVAGVGCGSTCSGGGLPPEKWSSLMYGLWPDGGLKNAKEATHG
jgi:hypothetical protein